MKYLKNTKTGVVFPYSERLRKNGKNLVPCDKKGNSAFEEVPAPDDQQAQKPQQPTQGADGFEVDVALKQDLLNYAYEYHGIELNKKDTAESLREQVRDLIEAAE